MVLDVIHPARPNVSKAELSEKLSEMYKTPRSSASSSVSAPLSVVDAPLASPSSTTRATR